MNGTVAVNQQKKTRVAIVGLLHNQQNKIIKEMGDALDLRFASKEQKSPTFPDADKVVLCVDFISHNWRDAAIARFGNDNVIKHYGGVTGVITVLKQIAAKK